MSTDHDDGVAIALRTKLYRDFLRNMSSQGPSLQNVHSDITLGFLIDELNENISNFNYDETHEHLEIARQESFPQRELYVYGTPIRQHLSHLHRKQLFSEVQKTLRSITEFFYGGLTGSTSPSAGFELAPLSDAIQLSKTDILSMRLAIRSLSSHITDLAIEINKNHDYLDQEMKHAKLIGYPLYDSARTASIDLLAATIEASLVKLSLTKACSEKALYNYRSRKTERQTVGQAIEVAYASLKKEEHDMKTENQRLDRRLEEYETLLQIVDGGGYQQIINDWTKVKQETDECMKDLRRLGWTGD